MTLEQSKVLELFDAITDDPRGKAAEPSSLRADLDWRLLREYFRGSECTPGE